MTMNDGLFVSVNLFHLYNKSMKQALLLSLLNTWGDQGTEKEMPRSRWQGREVAEPELDLRGLPWGPLSTWLTERQGGVSWQLGGGRQDSVYCVFFFTLRTEHCLFTDCAELFLRSVYWGQTQMSLCHRGQGCSFLTANTEKLTTGNCSMYLLPSLTFSYCVLILIIRKNVSVRLSSLKSNGKE